MKTEADLILEDISYLRISGSRCFFNVGNLDISINIFHPKAQTTMNILSYMYVDKQMPQGYLNTYFFYTDDRLKILSLLEDMQ